MALAAAVLDGLLVVWGRLLAVSVLITLGLLIWGTWELYRWTKQRLIWKVRNRLIVTYLFIAAVPITLILALFFVAGWVLTGQFAGYLINSALERREESIEVPARLLARAAPQDRLAIAQHLTATGIQAFEALVVGPQEFRYPADSKIEMLPDGWHDFTGVIYRGSDPYLISLANYAGARAEIMMPLTDSVLSNLVPGLGTIRLPRQLIRPPDQIQSGVHISTSNASRRAISVDGDDVEFATKPAGKLPPAYNAFDVEVVSFTPVRLAEWGSANSGRNLVILGTTRLSAVLRVVFPEKIQSSQSFLVGFYVLLALLGLAELISLFIGVSMTRTITGAVHNLYEGTMRIGEGDFVHRIPVRGKDQLADLGHSFNKMAAQLQQFVVVTREKERLQSEIAIASEVQTRLFPHKPPAGDSVEMLGVCHAARMVSGDYYDYFTAADGELALALGDVAGKGISAALLMASIQSIMRTQLSEGIGPISPSATVERLNRLLYASTSPEKYATFFFGLYQPPSREVIYTNAGHLPPLLIHGDTWELLEVTGSVVGAFPSMRYEERTVSLGPGDLLVAYTDGITEPENAYGEDFGTERLAEVVMRYRDAAPSVIVEKVLQAVRHWDTSKEQADDMTLLIVRGIG